MYPVMIMLLWLLFISILPSDSINRNLLDDFIPNEFFLNRTFHSAHVKRDQSKFNNDLCKEHLEHFKIGIDQKEPWALQSERIKKNRTKKYLGNNLVPVFDSWSKQHSGMLHGNNIHFGDLALCNKVQHGQIKGQFCMVFYKYTDKLNSLKTKRFASIDLFDFKITSKFAKLNKKKFGSGICVPASCNEDMTRSFANEQLREFNLELATDYNQDLFCQIDDSTSSKQPMKPITIIAIGKFKLWILYAYRYLTITPIVAFTILFFLAFPAQFASSAMFKIAMPLDNCQTYWWSTLLHIQNYFNPHNLCMEFAWYMSVDFQLILITPFLIYPAWKYGLKYLFAIPAIIAIVNVFIYYKMARNEISMMPLATLPSAREYEIYETQIYYPTHTRCIPWLMGILLGFKMHHLRGKKEVINKYIKALLWTLSLGSIVISPLKSVKYNSLVIDTITYEDHALFYVTAKMFWSTSIVWIIFACHNGDGGIIHRFLSNSMWKPISKMSLIMFLNHVPFLNMAGFEFHQPIFFSENALVK
ncbi:unnamed protein product [Diamesa serratosioi]